MFDAFHAKFRRDRGMVAVPSERDDSIISSEHTVLSQHDILGKSFNGGLYRTFRAEQVADWTRTIEAIFVNFKGRASCFGYDWLGRVFALDGERQNQGEREVLMFDPGTGDALEIPGNIVAFHNHILVEMGEAALSEPGFYSWLDAGRTPLWPSQCVGYTTPLFLGGNDVPDNLETTDMDVYWHLTGQLTAQLRDVADGTPVKIVR